MTQINLGLKRVFTIFNVFFAVVGGVIVGLALLLQFMTNVEGQSIEGRFMALIGLYLFGAITMAVAILGAYGAHRESKGALIAFLVLMIFGTLAMLRIGIPAALSRPMVRDVMVERFRAFLPLDEAEEDVKNMADALQTQFHCCGLFSASDWRDRYPDSCLCDSSSSGGDECRTVDYSTLMQSKSIYAKPCFRILLHVVLLVIDIMLGVVFTLAVLALLGMTLSSIMIHQLRFPNRPSVLLSVPSVFSPAPPKYQELQNPPTY